MGGDNFTKYKITEEIGKGNIKVIPDVMISGLLGLKLMDMMDANAKKDDKAKGN